MTDGTAGIPTTGLVVFGGKTEGPVPAALDPIDVEGETLGAPFPTAADATTVVVVGEAGFDPFGAGRCTLALCEVGAEVVVATPPVLFGGEVDDELPDLVEVLGIVLVTAFPLPDGFVSCVDAELCGGGTSDFPPICELVLCAVPGAGSECAVPF